MLRIAEEDFRFHEILILISYFGLEIGILSFFKKIILSEFLFIYAIEMANLLVHSFECVSRVLRHT